MRQYEPDIIVMRHESNETRVACVLLQRQPAQLGGGYSTCRFHS